MDFLITIKEFIFKNVVSCITMLLVVILGGVWCWYTFVFNDKEKTQKDEYMAVITPEEDTKDETKEVKKIKVDIKGQIKKPGVYELQEGSIVNDVIKLAGGIKSTGTTINVNLSKKVTDEMVIVIYKPSELKNKTVVEVSMCPSYNLKECETTNEVSSIIEKGESNSNTNTDSKVTTKISINTATLSELMTLNGIGESKAKNIISYREENGPFASIEDIKNVTGIGDSIFDTIKESITI